MNPGFLLILYAILISVFLNIIYFSKQRIRSVETKIYGILIIVNLVGLFVELMCNVSGMAPQEPPEFLKVGFAKLYIVYLVLWLVIMTLYVITISIKNYEKNRRKVFIGLVIIAILSVIAIFKLPIEFVKDGTMIYTKGPSVDFVKFFSIISFVVWITFIALDYDKKKKKKYLPIILIIVNSFITTFIQSQNPGILIATAMETFAMLVMFFTIENPDVKLIASLELSKNQAERANRAKSDFLSSMSHEIRTPLNAIVGLSNDILEYQYQVPKEVLEDSNDIVEASNTLLEIVGNILDISKIEGGKLEIIPVEYNFKEELSSLAKINKVRIGVKPIEFKLNIAEDIPYELIGDKLHIKEILNNLISNAIKYTEKGMVSVNAQCINRGDNCNLIITVQDTGRGIKKEDMDKLFAKFDRLEVEKSSTVEGTGLGLAITKNLVELMDGKINVQSNFGQGSIFMVQIPQKISKMEEPLNNKQLNTVGKVLSEKNADVKDEDLGNKTILLVDDNALNIKVAQKALQPFNFEIETASNGEEAVRKAKEREYDLILMDIMMPVMSGETALEELKKDPKFKTPVIALTADAVQGSCEKYLEEGFTDYIAKPFSKEQIKEKLVKIFIK